MCGAWNSGSVIFRLPQALEESDTTQAVGYLRAYYSRTLGLKAIDADAVYSGEYFDQCGEDPSPHCFTPEDLFAVSCLSTPIPAEAGIQMLREGEVRDHIAGLLRQIPRDIGLWELEDPRLQLGNFELERYLQTLPGIGQVRATKLIARKRPDIYPVVDRVVRAVTGTSTSKFTVPFAQALRADDYALVMKLVDIRTRAELPRRISLLRVFDVVAWMEGTAPRWSAYPAGYSIGAPGPSGMPR